MRTSLVLIGDELLNGSVSDSATLWIGGKLYENGFELTHVQLVADELATISEAIAIAIAHGDAVILTGGLGPTSDDLTRNALARLLRAPLLRNQYLLKIIAERYATLGREMPEIAGSMADLPEGAAPLRNAEGSAPGIKVVVDGVPIFALPGVPREMRAMFVAEVLPELLRAFETEPRTTYILRVAIEGESAVAMKLRDWEQLLPPTVTVAYLTELGNVLVKITGIRDSEVHQYAQSAAARIGDCVYALQDRRESPISLERAVYQILVERGETIASAESLTGGAVGVALTQVPGSSETYVGGFVAYSPALKTSLLGVSEALISEVGTVNPQVAYEMALGARRATGADWSVATTGVAGPESEGKSPGTVYIAVVGPPEDPEESHSLRVIRLEIAHLDREQVRRLSVIHALELVRRTLKGLGNATGAQDVSQLAVGNRNS